MKTRRRSRRSGRLSTTSPAASKPSSLAELIAALPPERASAVFTHSSWAPARSDSYERLEFLGDSVLELAVARTLYERFPEFTEGQMAKLRSHVVSRASCAEVARELNLGARFRLEGRGVAGDDLEMLAENRNVLAAVLEAALAALFLEHGFEPIEHAVVEAFDPRIQFALTHQVDHKTELQETVARLGRSISYALINEVGPPHDRTFTSAAMIDGQNAGEGTGRSKKDAEQEAARKALEYLAGIAEESTSSD